MDLEARLNVLLDRQIIKAIGTSLVPPKTEVKYELNKTYVNKDGEKAIYRGKNDKGKNKWEIIP